MAKLFIGAIVGREIKQYSEVEVKDLVSEKSLSFYLGCDASVLESIAENVKIKKVLKDKPNGKLATFYRVEDFGKIVNSLKSMPNSARLEQLTFLDTSGNFEIVYPTGSKIRFIND